MASNSSQAPLVVTLALVAIAGALTWFLLNPSPGTPPPVVTPGPASQTTSAPPAPASTPTSTLQPAPQPIRPAAPPTRNPVNVSQMVLLPDGTYIPTINGVENPTRMPWPAGRPWSPIVGTQRGQDGLDWFVHADGARSQVRMLYRSDLNREDQTWVTGAPTQVRPPGPLEGGQAESRKQ
jgi:hypothetical protein